MDVRAFTEHRVPRDRRGSLYVRDFPGSGAAFVLLRGFPDNSHIYDDLIPPDVGRAQNHFNRLLRFRGVRQTGGI